MNNASAPASTSAVARSTQSGPTPTAAPQRSCPLRSFAALVKVIRFSMSAPVISPASLPSPSTSGSFSIRFSIENPPRLLEARCPAAPSPALQRRHHVLHPRLLGRR